MKIKLLAVALSVLFTVSLSASTYNQLSDSIIQTSIVDNDNDKTKKSKKSKKNADLNSSCSTKKSCCSKSGSKDLKSSPDKR
ncbi:MAG: hypothetical protein CMF58_05750 [Lentimicrobiaceae bacterium]|jgi:hypothetical protein|nr:hypothetical protein [Lentimicrobiaceae bacterium]|tara:strand:+ start:5311 stop:5556 length:246 start_codon:yes stop_codon:yes gene_type:complete